MACGIILLAITISIVVGLALPAAYFYEAFASTGVNGVRCEVPENADEMEETYRSKSDAALVNWELESVVVGCGGSISASYVLPEFSDNDTTFRVYLQQDQPLQAEEDPFPADFIKQRDLSVAQSISNIMSNYVFKEVDKEFTHKTISFFYGASSYFYISAYKGSENCKSDFEVDMLHPELLDFTISNDADIETVHLIKVARGHASEQLQNISAGAMEIRNASDASCGRMTVLTSHSMDDSETDPYSYTATVDIECNATISGECPEEIKLVYGPTFQSPITSSIINSTAAGGSGENVANPHEQKAGGTDEWFYTAAVPIGIGSAVAGAAIFVVFRRLS